MAVEARVGQEGARARQRGGQGEPGGAVGARGGILRGAGQGVGERPQDRGDVVIGGGLVDAHAHVVGIEQAQVVAQRLSALDSPAGGAGQAHAHRVEELLVLEGEPERAGADGQVLGPAVHVLGDGHQALGTVVDRVEGRDDRQQGLRGADIRGGLLPANVLLAGLQGQAVGLTALGVPGDADDASRQLAPQRLGDGHEARVGASEEQGHPQALRGTDGDVRADGARLGQQRQGQRVGIDCHQAAAGVDGRDGTGEVLDESAAGGVGEDRPGQGSAVFGDRGDADDLDVDAQGLGPGRGHLDELGVQAGVEEHGGVGAAVRARHEQDGLGHGRGLIQQGGAGHRQAGEIGHDGLEQQLGLQAPLADLRLVGGVGGGPSGVGQDVAHDDGGGDGGVVAAPDHLGVRVVESGQGPEGADGLVLAQPADDGIGSLGLLRGVEDGQGGGDHPDGQVLQAPSTDAGQDRVQVRSRRAQVPVQEARGCVGRRHNPPSHRVARHILVKEPASAQQNGSGAP